ncbi:hypothetical protein [uncultured Tateyamaria sp.]|uniref:hypothetical protein n=1 Tax=uncultured Tateyamaria sp. TaxID=455651 RepID=UPI0026213A75|nr:hypothetical protein [uncultured Tateyamaria sp.]
MEQLRGAADKAGAQIWMRFENNIVSGVESGPEVDWFELLDPINLSRAVNNGCSSPALLKRMRATVSLDVTVSLQEHRHACLKGITGV